MRPLLVALFLSSCALAPAEPPGPAPTNAYQTIHTWLQSVLIDPESLRDFTFLEGPRPGRLLGTSGWLVCFTSNSRNRFGGYTGTQISEVAIRNDQIVQHIFDRGGCI